MKYVLSYDELAKSTLYNCIRKNAYNADGYLTGITIESADYKEIFEKYRNQRNVIF